MLIWADDVVATEFLAAFPEYQIDKRIGTLRRERQLLKERLDQRLRRSGFDLSRVQEDHRWTVAMRCVEAHDKIADLHRHERELETANGLGNDWLETL
jgi:hypothetical protein